MNECRMSVIALLVVLALAAVPVIAQEAPAKTVVATPAKVVPVFFTSPEAAAAALYEAVKAGDIKLVDKILGSASSKLIYTGDEVADRQMREHFLDAYEESLKIERSSKDKAILLTGENEAPFPYPLVSTPTGWQFDSTAGADEIINRRIGGNELTAIKFCLAYGDAQREYAEMDRNGNGLIEYAQRFRSSEGQHDGLFWKTKEGEPESPLGPLAAQAVVEGYAAKGSKPTPYHGYYYRILTAQGSAAHGGAYDYIVKGRMIGGFALVAYPARWGASGVMTFTCNHDGVVYQKNLSTATAEIASKMKLFNPDKSWQKVEQDQ